MTIKGGFLTVSQLNGLRKGWELSAEIKKRNYVECFECKKIFHRRGRRKLTGTYTTCSLTCKNKHQSKYSFKTKPRTGSWIDCKKCGKKTYRYPSSMKMYCSTKCFWEDESSSRPKGDSHYAFKGGVKYIRHADLRLRKWQRELRRKYPRQCFLCGTKDGIMHADHILPWADFPDLRYDLNNGQILCKKCHSCKTAEENKNRLRNKFLNEDYKWKIYYEYMGDKLWQ